MLQTTATCLNQYGSAFLRLSKPRQINGQCNITKHCIIERSVTSRYHGSKIPGSQQSLFRETAICILERWKKSMKEQSCTGEYSNNSATIKLYWFFPRLIDFCSSEKSDVCALIDMAATFSRPRFVKIQKFCFHGNVT